MPLAPSMPIEARREIYWRWPAVVPFCVKRRAAPLREQPQTPEARMALATDHQVVVDPNAQRLGRLLDLPRHLDVVARRFRIARGMVVHEDERGRAEIEGALHHLAR